MDRDKKLSRYLSKVLRHQPERVGVELTDEGWVDVDVLIAACRSNGVNITTGDLHRIVSSPANQRYELDSIRNRVRARYGHSLPIKLGTRSTTPPDTLFHGTSRTRVDRVLAEGLHSMGRHMVHLSTTREQALRVGRRHGHPAILVVDAQAASADGAEFFPAGPDVWLVEWVDSRYLRVDWDQV